MFILRKFRSILNKQDISKPEHIYRNNNENTHEANKVENDIEEGVEIGLSVDKIETKMETDPEIDFPSIYIDEKVLERFIGHPYKERDRNKNVFHYEINGAVFWDDVNVDDKLMRFEVKEHFKDNDEDRIREDLTQGEFGAARNFQIAMQKTPYGLVINSTIVVTENAWNTIVCGDETTCIACNKGLDIPEIADHIATDHHKYALDKYKPLEEFEMNIVRNIDNKYHCGICNITFYDEHHLESISHGDKFLRALNKVSDIEMEYIDNKIETHRNRNTTIEDSSGFDSESFDGFYDDVRPIYYDSETDDKDTKTVKDPNLFSYADIAKKPKAFEPSECVDIKLDDRTAKVKFDCWHMVITLKTNNFYCMACKVDGPIRDKSKHCLELNHVENLMKCCIVKEFKEHVVRKVDDKLYHCGHCNNLHMLHEIRDHLETNHKKYVMTNIISEREPLSKCAVIKSSPKAVKRNNSVVSASSVEDRQDRIIGIANESNKANAAPFSYSSEVANIPANHPDNTVDGIKEAAPSNQAALPSASNPTQIPHNQETVLKGSVPINVPTNQFVQRPVVPSVLPIQCIIVRAFNQVYRLSDLAFNSIQLWPNGYICLICEKWCHHDVRGHLVDPVHGTRIVHAPFLPHTSFHLIRPTKYGFHCVICDILMRSDPINHTWDRMHLAILSTAIRTPNVHSAGTPVVQQKQKTVETNQTISTAKNETDKKEPETTDKEETTDNKNEIGVTEMDEKDFDSEGCLYVKVKNVYTKITMTAYNGLVQTGNGARYCVLCSVDVFPQELKAHVFSKGHILNLEQCKFLKKYERHLLRQLSSYYHCALCNVCVLKKFLNKHLVWEPHAESESKKIVMHIRQNEIKSGVKEVTCLTQKEINAEMSTDFEILVNIKFELQEDFANRIKIVNLNGVVMTLSWYSFHGICKRKNGLRCIICQTEFKANEMSAHVEKPMHSGMLENSFQLEHSPALIRKINDSTLHCLTCNVEVNNDKQIINDHKVSKSHTNKYATTVTSKSNYDASDVLTLKGNNSKKKKKNT